MSEESAKMSSSFIYPFILGLGHIRFEAEIGMKSGKICQRILEISKNSGTLEIGKILMVATYWPSLNSAIKLPGEDFLLFMYYRREGIYKTRLHSKGQCKKLWGSTLKYSPFLKEVKIPGLNFRGNTVFLAIRWPIGEVVNNSTICHCRTRGSDVVTTLNRRWANLSFIHSGSHEGWGGGIGRKIRMFINPNNISKF